VNIIYLQEPAYVLDSLFFIFPNFDQTWSNEIDRLIDWSITFCRILELAL